MKELNFSNHSRPLFPTRLRSHAKSLHASTKRESPYMSTSSQCSLIQSSGIVPPTVTPIVLFIVPPYGGAVMLVMPVISVLGPSSFFFPLSFFIFRPPASARTNAAQNFSFAFPVLAFTCSRSRRFHSLNSLPVGGVPTPPARNHSVRGTRSWDGSRLMDPPPRRQSSGSCMTAGGGRLAGWAGTSRTMRTASEGACQCQAPSVRRVVDPEGMAGRRKRNVVRGRDARVERTRLPSGVEGRGGKRDVGAGRAVAVRGRSVRRRGLDGGADGRGQRLGPGASAERLGFAGHRKANQVEDPCERGGARSVTVGIRTHGDKRVRISFRSRARGRFCARGWIVVLMLLLCG